MLKMLNITKYMEQYMEFADLGLKGILTLWHSTAQACFFFFFSSYKYQKCQNVKNISAQTPPFQGLLRPSLAITTINF
jgi:hypothetical protein